MKVLSEAAAGGTGSAGTILLMTPHLYRRDPQHPSKRRQQDVIRNVSVEMAADKGAYDRAASHDEQEHSIPAQDRKAVVAAIARESDEDGGETYLPGKGFLQA
jgi:hypothetical protein